MKKNTSVAGSAKCNGINYQGQEINASNLSSTTNYLEGAKSTITLSQSEDCKIYSYVNIYLHTNDNITAPIDSVKALKYKLITEDKIEYNGTITTKGDSLLAVVPLTSAPKNYQVYLWIDSEISSGQYDNKSFSGYIYATSEQSSTIGSEEISNNENVSIETIDFDYVGREQEFIVPVSGDYKLETWGAQGDSSLFEMEGGVGGYSSGSVLSLSGVVFVTVGKFAQNNQGGGTTAPGGGGATYITTESDTLNNFENDLSKILIVSGGGGGSEWYDGIGGSGGVYIGNSGGQGFLKNDTIDWQSIIPTASGGSQVSGGQSTAIDSRSSTISIKNGMFGVGGKTSGGDGGHGKEYDAYEGLLYDGEWKNGVRNGEGTEYAGDAAWSGVWKNGKKDGQFRLLFEGGMVEEVWNNGVKASSVVTRKDGVKEVRRKVGRKEVTVEWNDGERKYRYANDGKKMVVELVNGGKLYEGSVIENKGSWWKKNPNHRYSKWLYVPNGS